MTSEAYMKKMSRVTKDRIFLYGVLFLILLAAALVTEAIKKGLI